MMTDNYVRKVVTLEQFVDGDTIVVWLDQGDYEHKRYILRFARINTPEKNQEGYEEASKFVVDAMQNNVVHVQTIKEQKNGNFGFKAGGFNRYLAEILVGEGDNQYNLNDKLLELGLAKLYKRKS